MIDLHRIMLDRVHAMALAAMASVAPAAPPPAAAPPAPLSCLEMAWLKSVGRVPGQAPPPGGWERLAALAGFRPTVACPVASLRAPCWGVGGRGGGSGRPSGGLGGPGV